jgi:thiol-disulfide isomerase/thioredoxin
MKGNIIFILLFSFSAVKAQSGYAVNDLAGDFPIREILNHTSGSSTFLEWNDRLLVIDFFGTWCAPCVKALPKLTAFQQKYKQEIRILLVSEESREKLEGFIRKQTGFGFPVVVDEEKAFVQRFRPPAYPYTVIVGRNGKILAIPSQEEMTETNMNKWLGHQNGAGNTVRELTNTNNQPVLPSGDHRQTGVKQSTNKLVQLSQDFMYAAKTGEETAGYVAQLKTISLEELLTVIQTDEEKKAFWINLYNAYTQELLAKDPGLYQKRGQFFGSRQIEIAGKQFSLDDIEHGILRRSKIKWSLGHLNKPFPGKTEKLLRVSHLDYRLHFALNCGAKSCPPIAFYRPEDIGQQLDAATKAFLRSEAVFQEEINTVELPAIMGWFRRDFGGKKKMITLLQQLQIVPAGKDPRIRFKTYDWTLYLQHYKS